MQAVRTTQLDLWLSRVQVRYGSAPMCLTDDEASVDMLALHFRRFNSTFILTQHLQDNLKTSFGNKVDGFFDRLEPSLWTSVMSAVSTILEDIEKDTDDKARGSLGQGGWRVGRSR